MRKIPTLFARDRATGKVDTTLVTPGCEWVIAPASWPGRFVVPGVRGRGLRQ